MKKVQILMSTYNGENYLREQIDSILGQEYGSIEILIRDDGSTDETLSILKEYEAAHENIRYYAGENIGAAQSFFDLMKNADKEADYYAFSDQDDVWLPEKITRAIKWLESEGGEIPLLYAGKTTPADEQLNEMQIKRQQAQIKPSFGNALVENVCVGCTEVFNRALLELVIKKLPEFTVMHDWWLYLSAAAFGKVIFDKEAHILYRQHANNQIGMQCTRYGELRNRIKNFRKSNGVLRKQALQFRTVYGTDYKKSRLTDWVADYKKVFRYRCSIVLSGEIHRQRKSDDLIFRVLFLLGMR